MLTSVIPLQKDKCTLGGTCIPGGEPLIYTVGGCFEGYITFEGRLTWRCPTCVNLHPSKENVFLTTLHLSPVALNNRDLFKLLLW